MNHKRNTLHLPSGNTSEVVIVQAVVERHASQTQYELAHTSDIHDLNTSSGSPSPPLLQAFFQNGREPVPSNQVLETTAILAMTESGKKERI
ncbi:hypothetical protein BGX24_006857 [Mortierella sp. AD032]|nr:hypothetical protein BGX24_006857 [Mortierella sp. AD032]